MPQDEKTIIRSILQPKIPIDLIELEDLFQGTSDKLDANYKGKPRGQQLQKDLGTDYPYISINGYVFDPNEIKFFEIASGKGFLPTVVFSFVAKSDAFRSQGMPKDGDIMNVFIRAKNDAFKPIRNDYLITNLDASPGGHENRGGYIKLSGELFIPRIHDQIITSIKGSSFNTLIEVAKKLQLGFATNETSTNDSQAWICGGDTLMSFIKHITQYSWKDESSFYRSFIDFYYNLNFINVNNQLEGDGQTASAILDAVAFKDYYIDDQGQEKNTQYKAEKFLSDIKNLRSTNMFIENYQTVNKSSEMHKESGYKHNVQFFDMKSLKYWEIYVDPKTSDGAERKKMILKGRTFPKKEDQKKADGSSPSEYEYWKTQNRYQWKGIQSTNVHDNYLFAESNNRRNLLELEKLYIIANVTRWNPNIYMGEKIPLAIVTSEKLKAQMDAQGKDREALDVQTNPLVLDQFHSGYYMVNGMSITWDANGQGYSKDPTSNTGRPSEKSPAFFQSFTLTRREWPTPKG